MLLYFVSVVIYGFGPGISMYLELDSRSIHRDANYRYSNKLGLWTPKKDFTQHTVVPTQIGVQMKVED